MHLNVISVALSTKHKMNMLYTGYTNGIDAGRTALCHSLYLVYSLYMFQIGLDCGCADVFLRT